MTVKKLPNLPDIPDPESGPSYCQKAKQALNDYSTIWSQALASLRNASAGSTEYNSAKQLADTAQQFYGSTWAAAQNAGCVTNLPSHPSPYTTETVESPIYCKMTLIGSLLNEWNQLASAQSSLGMDVKSYLGFPMVDEYDRDLAAAHGLYVQQFERGALISQTLLPGKPVHVVYGRIYQRYWGLKHVLGPLGLPLTTQATWNGGDMAIFEQGTLYAKNTTAYWLDPTFAAFYASRFDRLGWPTSDSMPLKGDRGIPIGSIARFEKGAAYRTRSGNMFTVSDSALSAYYISLGGLIGKLGVLQSDTMTSPGGALYNNCANGVIIKPSSGPLFAVTTKDIRFLHCDVDNGSEGSLGGGPDLYLEVTIAFNGQTIWNAYKLPDDQESYEVAGDINRDVALPRVLRGEDVLTVSVRGRDHKDIGSDGDYGVIQDSPYTIDNKWGFDVGPHDNGQFRITFRILDPPEPIDSKDPWREKWFWNFENIGTKSVNLSKAEFEETFTDVGEGDKWYWHPLNALFYDFYKGSASHGRCFGMCLAQMYCQAGNGYYNVPLDRFDVDGGLWNEIEIKHGYQLGDPAMQVFAQHALDGTSWSARSAFLEIAARPHEMWLLNITKNLDFTNGHTVRVYDYSPKDPLNHPGEQWELYIANPNYPYSRQSDDLADSCKVVIFDEDAWSLRVKSTEVWTGSAAGGGWIYPIAFADLSYKPSSLIADIPLLLAAGVAQGFSGLVALVTGGADLHVDEDASRRATGSVRPGPQATSMPLMAQDGANSNKLVYVPIGGGSVKLRVSPDGDVVPTSLGIKAIPFECVFQGTLASSFDDEILVSDVGKSTHAVTYTASPRGPARILSASFKGRNRDRYDVAAFTLQPGHSTTFSMTQCMRELVHDGGLGQLAATLVAIDGSTKSVTLGIAGAP